MKKTSINIVFIFLFLYSKEINAFNRFVIDPFASKQAFRFKEIFFELHPIFFSDKLLPKRELKISLEESQPEEADIYSSTFSTNIQVNSKLSVGVDCSYNHPQLINEDETRNYFLRLPIISSFSSVVAKFDNGFNAGLRYRFETGHVPGVKTQFNMSGNFLLDGFVGLSSKQYEIGFSLEDFISFFRKNSELEAGNSQTFSDIYLIPEIYAPVKVSVAYKF